MIFFKLQLCTLFPDQVIRLFSDPFLTKVSYITLATKNITPFHHTICQSFLILKCWKYWISILDFRHQDNFRYISDIEILEILDFNIEFQTRSGPESGWPPHTTEEQVEAVQGWESTQQKSQEEENGGNLKITTNQIIFLEFSCWFFLSIVIDVIRFMICHPMLRWRAPHRWIIVESKWCLVN